MRRGAEILTDKRRNLRYGMYLSASERASMLDVEYVYLLTLSLGDSYELIGVFLDPLMAQQARQVLLMRGIDPDILDIDHAPIGIVDLRGVDSPFLNGPVH